MPPMRRRFQFSLRALLILMLAFACFFGGMAVQRQADKPKIMVIRECGQSAEAIVTPDGKTWIRFDADD
jgi:hypothetical protein